jgi:hypothetical protein
MDGSADRFLDLMSQLEDFTRSVSPEQAHTQFDETTLQLFWMRWPHDESELYEIGESG